MNVQISVGLPSELLMEILATADGKDRSKKIVKVLELGLQALKTSESKATASTQPARATDKLR